MKPDAAAAAAAAAAARSAYVLLKSARLISAASAISMMPAPHQLLVRPVDNDLWVAQRFAGENQMRSSLQCGGGGGGG